MGIERTIRPAAGASLSWPELASRLTALGETAVVRMIDGLPAFPDEVPGDNWQEVRLGLAGGMVTVRRAGRDFRCVTWGTSDDALRRSWNHLCLALAAATGGRIEEDGVGVSAEEFARRTGRG